MSTKSKDTNKLRAEAVRQIVDRLRSSAAERSNARQLHDILDDLAVGAPADSILREILSDANKRANLKRVAFPELGADCTAIDAALAAGNPLVELERLASASSFEFEGKPILIHAPTYPDGTFQRTKNDTIKVFWRESRLTHADKNALRSRGADDSIEASG